MKYKVGNIVLLCDGRTVYIHEIHAEDHEYLAIDCEKGNEVFTVGDSDISMLIT